MSETNDFYRAFEERYRGSRELIKERLRVYLPFVEPLNALHPDALAVDLGCGRGEWLELMRDVGVAARGVDLDDGMLAACRERGLPAEEGEALAFMRHLPEGSVAVVSAFHVVEHIPFPELQAWVQEALRVLRPGGLLILETPNPENLVVGTSSFYFDPTHQRPLPPQLLSFLPEHYGFARTAVLRLQEPQPVQDTVRLWDVLSGASPDFAVIAQKGGTAPEQWALFDAAFATPHGLQLSELAERYDVASAARLQAVAGELRGAVAEQVARAAAEIGGRLHAQQAQIRQLGESIVEQLASSSAELGGRLDAQQAQIRQLGESIAAHTAAQVTLAINEAAERIQTRRDGNDGRYPAQRAALQAERDALLASWSWRVTAPLRWAARPFMAGAARVPSPAVVPVLLRPLVAAMRCVLRDPQLSYGLNQKLMRLPWLRGRLVDLSKRAGIYPGAVVSALTETAAQPQTPAVPPAPLGLTGSARRVYQDLLDARAARKLH